LKKVLSLSVVFALFVFFGNKTFAKGKDASGLGIEVKGLYNIPGSNPGAVSFSNIPTSLRQVPTHSGDGWFGRPGALRTVPFNDFKVKDPASSGLESFSFRVAPQYSFDRVTLRGGASFDFIEGTLSSQRPKAGDFSTYRAVNQYGEEKRGTGTSLVYYSIYWNDSYGHDEVTPFIEVECRAYKFLSVFTGYNKSEQKYGLKLERGWDRWNTLQKYKVEDFGSVNARRSYYFGVRLGNPHVGFSVGFVPVKNEFSGVAPGTSASISSKNKMGVFASVDFRITHSK